MDQFRANKMLRIRLTLSRPGGGLLRPAPTLKLCVFKTVEAMTTKFGDLPKTYLGIFLP